MADRVDQNNVFQETEGDLWFKRNAAYLCSERGPDVVTEALVDLASLIPEPVHSLCEAGCANGWRLAAAAERLPALRRLVGFDVSNSAIADGKSRWPELDLFVAGVDDTGSDEAFDVVIVSFVLHWVDRRRLSRSIAAIDALVKDNGYLIVADFLPDSPCARTYHHRSDVELYTYKQDYPGCFLGLGIYQEFSRRIFAHGQQVASSESIPEQDRAVCSVLRKTFAGYTRS